MGRYPHTKAYFWEEAPFFRLLIPLVAGIVCYDNNLLHSIASNTLLFSFFVSLCLLVGVSYIKGRNTLITSLTFLLFNVAVFTAAYTICRQTDVRNDAAWFGNHTKTSEGFVARITDTPIEKERTWKLKLAILNSIENRNETVSGDGFVYIYKDEQPFSFQKGDTILIPNEWQPIKNSGNPFEFDYTRYCARNGLYYQQFLPANKVQPYKKGAVNGGSVIERCHDWCMARLAFYIQDTATRGLMQAMLIGDEVNMDAELRQAYSDTGIIHVVAISGSHITMFFILISALLFWIRHKKYHWVKYAIALPLVWFYVLMAGAPPSAIRSAIMFSLLAVGFALQKNQHSLNQLFATAFVLLCAEPMWLYSVGFQLSFVAVLSLILFFAPIYRLWQPANKLLNGLWATIVASLAAEILTAPLVVYYFHLFPVMFLVANIMAYLLMGFVMLLGALIILFSWLPMIAFGIAWLTIKLVTVFNIVIHALQKCNPVSFHFLTLSGYELFILFAGIMGIAVYLLKKKKAGLLIGLSSSCVLLFSFCMDKWQTLQQNKVVVYNMGSKTRIEHIQGKYFTALFIDTAISPDNYTLKAAHTGWGAWQEQPNNAQEVYIAGNKRILLLDAPFHAYSSVKNPVDALIIHEPLKNIDFISMNAAFSPKQIAICGHQNKKKVEQWRDYCSQSYIRFICISESGAVVWE
jgi:competence protein ComEC